jgi:hypothetical protein
VWEVWEAFDGMGVGEVRGGGGMGVWEGIDGRLHTCFRLLSLLFQLGGGWLEKFLLS